MKPILLKHESKRQSSFKRWRNANPYIHNPWHFHPEFEITYIQNDRGTLFVGDGVQSYGSGDIVLLGSYLPHEFHSINYPVEEDYETNGIGIHFKKEFIGKKFYNIPESRNINKLLKASEKGILFQESNVLNKIKELVINILNQKGIDKVLTLFQILSLMAESKNIQYLASSGFTASYNKTQDDKINKVYEYTHSNFRKDISLEEISGHINMTKTSFCRFFKSRTHKTFVQYLNEIRIGHACKLLLETNNTIAQIAYNSGFNNLSTFNKRFKDIKNMTPSEFRNIHPQN